MSNQLSDNKENNKMPKPLTLGFSNEQIEHHNKMKAKKMASVKTGNDVIHLDYFYGILDEHDIKKYEAELQRVGIKLSHFDKNGLAFASLNDYALQVFFGLSYPIVKLLGEGIFTNVVWEVIKAISISSWRKIKVRNKQSNKNKINFGLKMKFKNEKLIDFKLNSDFSEETTLKAMDMIFQYMNDQKSEIQTDGFPDFCEFNEDSNTWYKVNIMEEFRKKAEEQQKQRALKRGN